MEKRIKTDKMVLKELATGRKSTRKFSNTKIDISHVLYAIESALQAPSGSNKQPWKFVLIDEPQLKAKIRGAAESGERVFYESLEGEKKGWYQSRGLSWNKPFFDEAPLLIVIFGDSLAPNYKASIWLMIGYLLLALEERGLNSLTYTPSDPKKISSVLEPPTNYVLEAIIPIGYSAEIEKPKQSRKSLYDTIFINEWGNL